MKKKKTERTQTAKEIAEEYQAWASFSYARYDDMSFLKMSDLAEFWMEIDRMLNR